MGEEVKFEILKGKTLANVEYTNGVVMFYCTDGEVFAQEHFQQCCEGVELEDVVGGYLTDIVGETVLDAYEETSGDPNGMWTFYTIRTNKTTLTLRWYGLDNYYSVSVSFYRYAVN